MTDNFLHTPAEMMADYVQWAEAAKANPGIQFGIPALDKVMIPMRPGNFVAIIARPGAMKTTLLAILARNEADRILARGTQDKECVVFVTWEQSAEELTNFFLADGDYSASEVAWGEVPLDNIRKKAVKGVHKPIWIIGHGIARAGKVNTPRMYPEAVLKSIEAIEEKYHRKPTLLLFDYLQLIPVQYARDRVQQVTEIPHRIKEVALRVGVPAVAAVQARQEVDDRALKLPGLRDAQWASSIGQTADKLFSLWYPYKTEEPGSSIKVGEHTYTVTEDLLLVQFLKQRFAAGHGIYSFSIDPARLTLKELATQTKTIGGV